MDRLADYWAKATTADPTVPVNNYRDPNDVYRDWRDAFAGGTLSEPEQIWDKVLADSIHIHHPRYMGHQVVPPLPLAALAGLVSDSLNNGMAIYEMGQAASVIERIAVEETARLLGFTDQAGGFLTSGGTLANLTALLTARAAKVQPEVWTEGDNDLQLGLLVSEAAHRTAFSKCMLLRYIGQTPAPCSTPGRGCRFFRAARRLLPARLGSRLDLDDRSAAA